MILNSSQIARLAYKAGFRGEALNIAVAIAMAESGGNTAAYNPETAAGTPPGSGSRGLWQIYGVAHPEFNNESAFDPEVNARAAYKVFIEAGNRFSPWSTYNAGLANPTQNYAANIGGILSQGNKTQTQKPTPQKNALSNSLQESLKGAQSSAGGGQSPSINPLAGVPEAINNLPASVIDKVLGGRTGTDLTFYLLGSGFIVIAIIIILLGAAGAFAGSDVGKAAIKTAAIL